MARLSLMKWVLIVALLVGLSGETCNAEDDGTNCTSSCGNIHNISYPFRLKHYPKHCGNVMYTLSCENNITLVVDLPPSGKYYVQAINSHNQTIRLCSNPVNSSLYVDTAPCLNINASSLVQQKTYSYVKVVVMEVGDLYEGCSAEWVALALFVLLGLQYLL
ncbi:hypothetical protein PRUPE_2G087500 [Prunus persica]|uniref:Wall-associated receptor kinase galacturonan-binding domain-containing protein n=1 Tax=Prunus persica TaxID=3760 RepID=M5X5B9_PRUPE|nr:hypothetical protein PRUPE_2G087500 [Prunus persica]